MVRDYELARALSELLSNEAARAHCRQVVAAHGIYTAQDWLAAKGSLRFDQLIEKFGAALVGYLDKLAGVPGACGVR
jgi:hypothetical protein